MENRRSVKVLLAALCAAILALRIVPISDPDYHWHLHTGRYVVQHRAIPSVDPFSHTFRGEKWAFVDWVSDVAMFALHRLGGDTLVVFVFAAVGALAILLAGIRALDAVDGRRCELLAVTFLASAAVFFRITPRPQTLTFLLLALLLLLLDRARRDGRSLFFVPLVACVWQNLHGSAVVAVAVAAAYAIGAAIERRDDARRLALACLASIAALFVAVRPVDRLAAGFAHLGDPRVARLFPEWGHAFRPGTFGPHVVATIALLLLVVFGVRSVRAQLGLGAWLASVGLALFGFASVRFVPLAGIALAAPALVTLVERIELSASLRVAFAAASAIPLAFTIRRPGLGLERGYFPERAAEVLASHGLRGKLFNDVEQGGYLMWRLGDDWPVFVDGRSMALYGVGFVEASVTTLGPAFDAMLARYDVSVVVTAPNRRAGMLNRNPAWLLVYFDDVDAVFVRAADASPEARRLAYRSLQPTTWFDLRPYEADPARLAAARLEAQRALNEAPDSALAAVVNVALAIAARDRPGAEALLSNATAKFPHEQRVMRAGLLLCAQFEDRDCACERARAIEREFPHNSYTADAVARFKCP